VTEETESTQDTETERIVQLLRDRGIQDARVVLGTADISNDAALGAIKKWDDQPTGRQSTGLLVHWIREGGVLGYKRRHEREGLSGELLITDTHLRRIRALALSPDGMLREDVERTWSRTAERAEVTVGELIDKAVDEAWRETPPHPAMLVPPYAPSDRDPIIRYRWWVANGSGEDAVIDRPDPTVRRRDGEDFWSWACRFWRYKDPAGLVQLYEKMEERAIVRRSEELRRQDEAEAERQAQEKAREQRIETAREDPPVAVADPDEEDPENPEDLW
jgi:hypothetical protein